MTNQTSISIFQSSRLIAILKGEVNKTWKDAHSYVRTMAHSDGVEGAERWERPIGRTSYARGIYRAVNTFKKN